MPQRAHTDNRGSATEPKFYVPAGSASESIAGRLSRFWASLFNHGIETET